MVNANLEIKVALFNFGFFLQSPTRQDKHEERQYESKPSADKGAFLIIICQSN